LNSASGYLGSNEATLRSSLGNADAAHLKITWPDGLVSDVGSVSANQLLYIRHPLPCLIRPSENR